MGGGSWSSDSWKTYASTSSYHTKSTTEIYSSRSLDSDLDPKGKIRESCDSVDNPLSTPVIVALDVTGSMSSVLDVIARTGLNTLATEIYNRKPITNPHLLFMGIGDIECDEAPLQATQFEADIRIAKQLEKIWLEQGGGGNCYESYALAWYFAANQTKTDSFSKRNKKGYLFTIGDEQPTPILCKSDLERIGIIVQHDVDPSDLLTLVSREWEVFHIIIEEGSHCRSHKTQVFSEWANLLGQRAIHLSDHKKLAEVIVSTIQVCEGQDTSSVVNSWDGSTSVVVSKAVKDLTVGTTHNEGLVTL